MKGHEYYISCCLELTFTLVLACSAIGIGIGMPWVLYSIVIEQQQKHPQNPHKPPSSGTAGSCRQEAVNKAELCIQSSHTAKCDRLVTAQQCVEYARACCTDSSWGPRFPVILVYIQDIMQKRDCKVPTSSTTWLTSCTPWPINCTPDDPVCWRLGRRPKKSEKETTRQWGPPRAEDMPLPRLVSLQLCSSFIKPKLTAKLGHPHVIGGLPKPSSLPNLPMVVRGVFCQAAWHAQLCLEAPMWLCKLMNLCFGIPPWKKSKKWPVGFWTCQHLHLTSSWLHGTCSLERCAMASINSDCGCMHQVEKRT